MIGRPPNSPLFPYTTLFRSVGQAGDVVVGLDRRRSGAAPGLDHVRVERPLHEKARVLTAVLGREPAGLLLEDADELAADQDRKSTRLNSSHSQISYAVFCLK